MEYKSAMKLKKILFSLGVILSVSIQSCHTLNQENGNKNSASNQNAFCSEKTLQAAGRVQLLDYSSASDSYLFRGNLPDVDNGQSFDYSGLQSRMSAAAECSGKTLPSSYRLIDISLLDPIINPKDTQISLNEAKYFIKNKDLGKFVAWPILGSLTPPLPLSNTPVYAQGKLSSTFTYDNVIYRAQQLHRWMAHPSSSQSTVYYIHCRAGCDRTGILATAYKIINAKSKTELANNISNYWAIQNGSNITTHSPGCNRNPNYWAASQILWLCYYKIGELSGYNNWLKNSQKLFTQYRRYCLAPIMLNNDARLHALKSLPPDGMGKVLVKVGEFS